jgi:hypothetical protein
MGVNPAVPVDATGGLRPLLAFNWRVFSPTYGPILWISRTLPSREKTSQ